MKKTFLFLLCLLIFIPLLNVKAFKETHSIIINIYDNLENKEIYVDLLVNTKFNEDQININIVNEGFKNNYNELLNSEIVNYNVDGWVSYSAYFRNAKTSNEIMVNNNFYGTYMFATGNKEEVIKFKVAVCDKTGKIISISETINLEQIEKFGFLRSVDYSMETKEFNIDSSYLDFILYIVLTLVINVVLLIIVLLIELFIAKLFKIRPFYKLIFINLISQVILTMGIILLKLHLTIEVLLLQVIIYIFEYIAIKYYLKDNRNKQVIIYVLLANTISIFIEVLYIVFYLNISI